MIAQATQSAKTASAGQPEDFDNQSNCGEIDAGVDEWIFAFLGLTLFTASCLTFCLGDNAGLDHDGFEDAVRPTESDPIQPCFVSSGW